MTKPTYPTKLVEEDIFRMQEDDYNAYVSALEDHVVELHVSVRHYLTPRLCSEVPPEFPCLLIDTGEEFNGWFITQDHFSKYYKSLGKKEKLRYTHWLPLPPPPIEES